MFARTFTRIVRNKTAVRQMGGHAPAAPKEGFEGAVRKLIPHDHHVSLIFNHILLNNFCTSSNHSRQYVILILK